MEVIEINLLTEDDIPKLWKGMAAIRSHAKRAGCESENDEEILTAAASILPPIFSEDSRYARKDTVNSSDNVEKTNETGGI